MSLTPLMWRALERTQNQFRFMSTYPIEFDPVKQRYMKNDISVKLVPWVISVALLFTVTFVPCAILVLAQVQGFVSIPLTKFAVVAIFLAISGLCCLGDLIVFFMGGEMAPFFEVLNQLNDRVISSKE